MVERSRPPSAWARSLLALGGILLALFGGGCVALTWMLGMEFVDVGTLIFAGIIPLVAGVGLVVWTVRETRRARQAKRDV